MVYETIGQFMSKLMFFHGYVNEYNGFPKPLSKADEEKYIIQMLNGDKKAREKLINHNMRLVAHVAKKYNTAAEADDLISVGSIGLMKAVDSYKLEKGSSLSTYASRCIENEILMLLRANKKHKVCMSIDETIGYDKDGGELAIKDIIPQQAEQDPDVIVEKRVIVKEIKNVMRQKLSEREYNVITQRYGLDDGVERTQQEVANSMNISRSYISRIESKALSILKEEFSEYGNILNT